METWERAFIRMVLQCTGLIGLFDFLFGGVALQSQDFIVIIGFQNFVYLSFAIAVHRGIQNKIVRMDNMPKNGYFLQRKKMFVEAPFHNMYSAVPLNWKEQEHTTQEAQRMRKRQQEQKERLRQIYEMSVEDRMNKRFLNFDHSNPENQIFKKKNDDMLTKQLEMFNKSKILLPHHQESSNRSRIDNKETIQYDHYPPNDKNNAYMKTSHTKGESNQSNRKEEPLLSQKAANYYPQQLPFQANHDYNPVSREPYSLQNSTINYQIPRQNDFQHSMDRPRGYSPTAMKDRYQSLQSPYPRGNLGKQIQQLYTGSKPAQYPFRNVMPDKLQNYLRQKTKADRKRSYQVSLNLFKH